MDASDFKFFEENPNRENRDERSRPASHSEGCDFGYEYDFEYESPESDSPRSTMESTSPGDIVEDVTQDYSSSSDSDNDESLYSPSSVRSSNDDDADRSDSFVSVFGPDPDDSPAEDSPETISPVQMSQLEVEQHSFGSQTPIEDKGLENMFKNNEREIAKLKSDILSLSSKSSKVSTDTTVYTDDIETVQLISSPSSELITFHPVNTRKATPVAHRRRATHESRNNTNTTADSDVDDEETAQLRPSPSSELFHAVDTRKATPVAQGRKAKQETRKNIRTTSYTDDEKTAQLRPSTSSELIAFHSVDTRKASPIAHGRKATQETRNNINTTAYTDYKETVQAKSVKTRKVTPFVHGRSAPPEKINNSKYLPTLASKGKVVNVPQQCSRPEAAEGPVVRITTVAEKSDIQNLDANQPCQLTPFARLPGIPIRLKSEVFFQNDELQIRIIKEGRQWLDRDQLKVNIVIVDKDKKNSPRRPTQRKRKGASTKQQKKKGGKGQSIDINVVENRANWPEFNTALSEEANKRYMKRLGI